MSYRRSRSRSRDRGGDGYSRGGDANRKLFVGRLSYDTDKRTLEDVFSKYGAITDCVIPNDREPGQSKGFGFVEFDKLEDAEEAMKALDGTDIDGRAISVEFSRPKRSGGYGGGGGDDMRRPGDWTCPDCRANVFA